MRLQSRLVVTVVVERDEEPTEAECEDYLALALTGAHERVADILEAETYSIEHVGFQEA